MRPPPAPHRLKLARREGASQLSGRVGSHLYNSTLIRVRWFVRRFGASEVVLKPLRVTLAPLIIPRLRPESFQFRGQTYSCFYHAYNMTWAGERMVEIPVIQAMVEGARGKDVLEVGNVLGHYKTPEHIVVDKFEKGPQVLNEDIIEYKPKARFDLIVSISTFEHIGFDDDTPTSSGEKIMEAIRHCRSLLGQSGRLVITVPTGYNPDLDGLMKENLFQANRMDCLRRIGPRKWQECDLTTAFRHPYRAKYPYANAVVIAEFGALSENS